MGVSVGIAYHLNADVQREKRAKLIYISYIYQKREGFCGEKKRRIPKKGKIFPNVRREIAVKNTKNFFEKNVECSSMTSECHFGFFMFKKHKNPDAFVYFFSFVSFVLKCLIA